MFYTSAITTIPVDTNSHCFSEEMMSELVRSVVLVYHRSPFLFP